MATKEMTRREETTPEPVREGPRFVPHADIFESEKELTVLLDLPGVDSKDIDVNLDKGVLHVYGRAPKRQTEHQPFTYREHETGDYYRSFEVGEGIDHESISADHRDGVLTLHLPKSERLRPKRIEVRSK